MNSIGRREALGAIGATIGSAVISGCGGVRAETQSSQSKPGGWVYVPLSPTVVAAEAYRAMPDGGCMYGVMQAVLSTWSKETNRPLDGFPLHMFRYGEGGIGGFGSICGAVNAGAALMGLFENDKERRTKLIADLFSWYERTELPRYHTPEDGSAKMAMSAAESVLCHVSVAHWCKVSGAAPLSKEMGQRCRCLTADVAAKSVRLLNQEPDVVGLPSLTDARPDASKESPRSVGKMRCVTCHESSDPDPSQATVRLPHVEP